MDENIKEIMEKVIGTSRVNGACSIRINGVSDINSSEYVKVSKKENKAGIDVLFKKSKDKQKLYLPVIVSEENYNEKVYNTFQTEDNTDVEIIAGCGIHNCGNKKSSHDGIHEINVGMHSKLTYIEKHYAKGNEVNELNPNTDVVLNEGSFLHMVLYQIGGVNKTKRNTKIKVYSNASVLIEEKLLTNNKDYAKSKLEIELVGENSSARIVSRSVAKDDSFQELDFVIKAQSKSKGHIECDGIIMNNAKIISVPALEVNNEEANLIHEAAIGRIESEQIIKLMSLGLSKEEAENKIIESFLK